VGVSSFTIRRLFLTVELDTPEFLTFPARSPGVGTSTSGSSGAAVVVAVGKLVAVAEDGIGVLPGNTGRVTPGTKGDEAVPGFFGSRGVVDLGTVVLIGLGSLGDTCAIGRGVAIQPPPNPQQAKNTTRPRIGDFLIGQLNWHKC
jgi:hypothetical protein